MKYKPHAYQQYAIDFIESHEEAAVLLDMGLGKTVITLTAIANLLWDYFAVNKVLCVAPLRVASTTWPEEVGSSPRDEDKRCSWERSGEKSRIDAGCRCLCDQSGERSVAG